MSASLDQAIAVAGYYPQLATAVIHDTVAEESIRAHFVHAETTFDAHHVRRHMTVLLLTETRLIRVHVDDGEGQVRGQNEAAANAESLFLHNLRTVALTHVVANPENYGTEGTESEIELMLSVGGGGQARIEIEPVQCPDENCDLDHGYMGAMLSDEPMARVSTIADGRESVDALRAFAHTLRAAVGVASR